MCNYDLPTMCQIFGAFDAVMLAVVGFCVSIAAICAVSIWQLSRSE